MNRTTAPLIGQPVDRAEDRRFLTGAGTFVDDLKREGMLHAVILRSSVAHGRINGIDASAAKQAGEIPGQSAGAAGKAFAQSAKESSGFSRRHGRAL